MTSDTAQGWLTHLPRLARRAGAGGPFTTTSLVVIAGLVVVLAFGQQYVGSVLVLAFTYAIVTTGMAVQIGFSQQIAFSQSVLMGLGAYGAALLNTHLNMPTLLAAPIVMIASGLVALLLGSVVTRASGLALAVATIMLPLIATGYVSSAGYLGGSVGMPLSGNLWQASSPELIAVGNGLITVVALGAVVFIASRILHSDIGLELYALGVDERTAAAMGISTPRRKLELFVLGSMFAALGGAVYAGTQLFVPATLVGSAAELSLLIMLFVGGRRSILGAVNVTGLPPQQRFYLGMSRTFQAVHLITGRTVLGLVSLSSGWQTSGYPASELNSWGFPGFYDVFYNDQLASVQQLIVPRHYTRVALLEDNCGSVCLANKGSVQSLAAKYGFQLVSTQIDQVGATDVTPQVLAMLAAKPQIILFGLVPGTDSITAIRAIRAQNPTIPISECSACEPAQLHLRRGRPLGDEEHLRARLDGELADRGRAGHRV